MIMLKPLTIDGQIANCPIETGSKTTRWYCFNEAFRDLDGEWQDFYAWEPDPIGRTSPEFACDVTTSGIFLEDEKDLRESIRSALNAHLARHKGARP